MFPSLFASKNKSSKSPHSSSGKQEKDSTASMFASVVTPNAKKKQSLQTPQKKGCS